MYRRMRRKILGLTIILLLFSVISGTAVAKTTFGSGSGEPLPNLIEIEVYNVTGLSETDQRTGGNLIASGLNQTFRLNQSSETDYRFSFTLRNDGDQDWQIEGSDNLYHDGLNSSWNVTQKWYETSSTFDGGNFSEGKVTWNLSEGGTLNSGSTLTASYVVKVEANNSQEFQQQFKVNDTSENAGSYDYHRLDLDKIGYLDINLTNPADETIFTQNKTFYLNSTVECISGECGTAGLTPRYNASSSEPDKVIPEGSGEPFNSEGSQRKTCELDTGSCNVSWEVNATGSVESYHLLDVNASSETYSEVPDNDSSDITVQINTAIVMDLTFDTVEFGILNPGQQNKSAGGNDGLAYNITIDEQSIDVDSLWMKASPLLNQSNSYSIGASNLSYAFQNNIDEEERLSATYREVRTGISSGTVLQTFYWLDVPYGIARGSYVGELFVKANSTG